MAAKCYICNYYDPKRMSLFRIPNRNDEYSKRARVWLKLLDEKDENIHRIRICSDHFLKKKPSKADDIFDVDWVPNKNLGKYSKNWKRVEHYIKKTKTLSNENVNKDNVNDQPVPIPGSNRINVDVQNIANTNLLENDNPNGSNKDEQVTGCVSNKSDAEATGSGSNIRNEQVVSLNPNFATQGTCTENVDQVAGCVSNLSNAQAISNRNDQINPLNPDSSNQAARFYVGFKNRQAISGLTLPPLKKRKITIIEDRFFMPKGIQTELTSNDIDLLFEYYQKAIDERNELLLKISSSVTDVNFFKDNDKKTRFYTGLTNWKLLSRFFDLVKDYLPSHPNCKLSQFQMLVLTLMKLRLNLTFTDLGYRFLVDGTTASRNFHRCLYILFKKFNNSNIVHWPKERENLRFNTPSYFRCSLKDRVTVIIDCFEIFIERSSMLRALAQAFSHYKHHTTIKYLIGISMSGAIIFISRAFGGRTSDKEATLQSGFLENLEEGDLVLADKGFKIEDEVHAKNAHLKMPTFVKNGNQLHPTDIESSRKLSSLRIHVERVINILRQKFNICADIAEMSAISKQNDLFDRDLYDKIVFVCSCIVNICPSVVTSDFEI